MKKFFSLILVAMLSLSPIYAFATEDAQALTPTTSETPTEAAAETPAPEVSTEAPAAEAPASEVPAQGGVTDGDSIAETPSSEQLNTDTSTDATSDESEKTEEESSDTKTDDKKTDEKVDGEVTEDTEETDLEKDSEEELDEELEEELEEEEEKDKTSIPEHEHEFEYISNKDGTHIVKCIAPVIQEKEDGEEGETEEVPCDYEVVEECSYDEEGVCIYCEYVKPKEEPKFEPSISISIENASCKIGETNPVICMSISSKDFDIAYAQLCFANYSDNQFINLGFAQGKYFDYKENKFVHTENSSWYASPDITNDFAPGKYSVRSVYIRSTTGEAVHYSVESGNLAEGYGDYSIELASPTAMSLIKDMLNSSNDEKPANEGPAPGEDVFIEPEELEDMIEKAPVEEESSAEDPAEEEPIIDSTTNEAPVIEEQPVVEEQSSNESGTVVEEPNRDETIVAAPQPEEKSTEAPKAGESKGTETPSTPEPVVEETPKAEEPKATETPKLTNNRSNTDNSSNTKQDNTSNTTSNTILNFFKKLFGLK